MCIYNIIYVCSVCVCALLYLSESVWALQGLGTRSCCIIYIYNHAYMNTRTNMCVCLLHLHSTLNMNGQKRFKKVAHKATKNQWVAYPSTHKRTAY